MTTKTPKTPVNKFDQLAGLNSDEYREAMLKQRRHLPPAQVVPNNTVIARRIGELLIQGECRRVGNRSFPLWPVLRIRIPKGTDNNGKQLYEWKLTNQPLELHRSLKEKKEPKLVLPPEVNFLVRAEWEAKCEALKAAHAKLSPIDNPNYGRYYMSLLVPKMVNGVQVMKDNGYPETEMVGFKWFDETDYVTSGALWATAPEWVCNLLVRSWKPIPNEPEWPGDLTKLLFLQGSGDNDILKTWKVEIKADKETQVDDEEMDEADEEDPDQDAGDEIDG